MGRLKAANFVSRASDEFWKESGVGWKGLEAGQAADSGKIWAGRKTEKVPLHNALGRLM